MYKIKRHQAYGLILIFFFIQVLFGNSFGSSFIKPNFLIIITTFFALFTDKRFGCETGVVCGILLDTFSIRFFGLNTLLLAFSGYVVGKYNIKFYKDSIVTHVIITFAASLFVLSSLFLFINLRNSAVLPSFSPKLIFNPAVIASSLLNSFLGIWIYAFLFRIFRLSEYKI